MSSRFEQVTRTFEENSALELLREFYQVPVLAVLVSFMLWVRTRGWGTYITDGQVFFSGNDAWYHYRMTEYTIRHWPFTMPYDVWTRFPQGTSVGTFGTLFDQLMATAALLVGLGSPTERQVGLVVLFTPAVLGALTAIPVYLFGKRYGGRPAGLTAVLLLALTPGQFFSRSLAGFADHHIAEVFFMAWAAAAVLSALAVAETEMPVYELFVEREFDVLRRPVGYAALAGVALALYVWIWPPGVFFGGAIAAALLVHMLYRYVRGVSPEFDAVAGVVTFVVAAVLVGLRAKSLELGITDFSLVHSLLLLAAAVAIAAVAAGARVWDERVRADRSYYPIAIVAGGGLAVGLVFVLLPDLASFMTGQIERGIGLGSDATSRTVAEAAPIPLANLPQFLSQSYGLAFYVALGGAALVVYRYLRADEPEGRHAFLLVWFGLLVLATITQQRFDYYLVLPVAALNGVVLAWAVDLADADTITRLEDVEGYQVMAVVAVLLLIAAPLAIRDNTVVARSQPDRNDDGLADGVTPVVAWHDNFEFLENQTPAEGTYGRPDAEPTLRYYGQYPRTGDYEYGPGEYGVLSWWDYGHWITVDGERPAVANPFQQNADRAANVLLAPNESHALEIMRSDGEGAGTRYVMLDYKLGVAGTRKFAAPATWEDDHGLSSGSVYLEGQGVAFGIYNRESFRRQTTVHTPRSYESLRVRLYQFHGSALSPRTPQGVIVLDWEEVSTSGGGTVAVVPQEGRVVQQFQNMSAARRFVQRDGSAQIGGLPGIPSKRVPALEHFRLVRASERASPTRQRYPWTKTFERVPGATVEGEGPANETVQASVRMRMTNANRTFTYIQRARTGPDGEFTLTLPYSTTGYENWGPEQGRTNVSVRAMGPYSVRGGAVRNETGTYLFAGRLNVSEAKVIGADKSPIEFELRALQLQARNESGGSAIGPADIEGAAGTGASADADRPGDAPASPDARRPAAVPAARRGVTPLGP